MMKVMDVDVGRIAEVALTRVDSNPMSLAGRALGLSEPEIEAGFPVWAQLGAGLIAGVAVGAVVLPPMLRRIGLV